MLNQPQKYLFLNHRGRLLKPKGSTFTKKVNLAGEKADSDYNSEDDVWNFNDSKFIKRV